MFEMRPFLYVGCGNLTPVVFDVFIRDGKNVARIHRDGASNNAKWRVQCVDDYSYGEYGETEFNSPDEAFAYLKLPCALTAINATASLKDNAAPLQTGKRLQRKFYGWSIRTAWKGKR